MKPKCRVDGCVKQSRTRGLCNAHYLRWWKTGDVMAHVPLVPKGEPERFIEDVALHYDGDDCLTWPFSTAPHGYAKVWWGGRLERAARVVCRSAHGEPPTPEHEAAHSCGKGHEGCIAKRHLRWATPKENTADRELHGTMLRGEKAPWAKLTQADAEAIRSLKGSGLKLADVAARYGISKSRACDVMNGKAWV